MASWLRCPHCSQPLEALGGLVLGCENGHRLDSNRRGYLTALSGSSGIHGDPRGLLEARARFLARGFYDPIADAVAAALPPHGSLSVVDSGTGTGFYLSHVQSSRAEAVDAIVVDVSPAAVAMSVAATASPGLVADVWQPSPIRSERADAVLCVFAPRNPAEFARVLRADGRLVVVTPASDHLRELRAAGLLLGMQEDKLARLDGSLLPHFDLAARAPVRSTVDLDPAAARDLTSMGPSGHHELEREWPGGTVTVAVDVSTFQRR